MNHELDLDRPWKNLSREDQLWLDCWTLGMREENLLGVVSCMEQLRLAGGYEIWRAGEQVGLVGKDNCFYFDGAGKPIDLILN